MIFLLFEMKFLWVDLIVFRIFLVLFDVVFRRVFSMIRLVVIWCWKCWLVRLMLWVLYRNMIVWFRLIEVLFILVLFVVFLRMILFVLRLLMIYGFYCRLWFFIVVVIVLVNSVLESLWIFLWMLRFFIVENWLFCVGSYCVFLL